MESHLQNTNQRLLETMADFLDEDTFTLEEDLAGIKHSVPREKSDLHIRMAAAAFAVYRNEVLHQPIPQPA